MSAGAKPGNLKSASPSAQTLAGTEQFNAAMLEMRHATR